MSLKDTHGPASVRRPSRVRRRPSFTMLKDLLQHRLANQSQNVEPPWVGGTKVCSRHPGRMTKVAATPISGKNPPKIFFSRTGWPISTKLGMKHYGLLPIIVCSNDDPGVE